MTPARSRLFTVGGPVQAGDGLYLRREADRKLLDLCLERTYSYVLSCRQIGKSSLMFRTAEDLRSAGVRTAIVDLAPIGRTGIKPETWYLEIVRTAAKHLRLKADVVGWWRADPDSSPVARFGAFFSELVFAEDTSPAVVFLDEIDSTLRLDFGDDFFAAVRSLHDTRNQKQHLENLTFVLIGVATPGELVRDIKLTPFNTAAEAVVLCDFSEEAVQPLLSEFPADDRTRRALLAGVMDWTNGHPYLTQKLLRALYDAGPGAWNRSGVDEVVQKLFLGAREAPEINLQSVADTLLKRSPEMRYDLLTEYRRIRREGPIPDQPQSQVLNHLKLSGIVARRSHMLDVRNRIYREAFDEKWIEENRSVEVNRLILSTLRRIAVVVSFLCLPLLAMLLWTWQQRELERKSAAALRLQTETLRDATLRARDIATTREKQAADAERQARIWANQAQRDRRLAAEAKNAAAAALYDAARSQTAATAAEGRANAALDEANANKQLAATERLRAESERERAERFSKDAEQLKIYEAKTADAARAQREQEDLKAELQRRLQSAELERRERRLLSDQLAIQAVAILSRNIDRRGLRPDYDADAFSRALLLAIESMRISPNARADAALRAGAAVKPASPTDIDRPAPANIFSRLEYFGVGQRPSAKTALVVSNAFIVVSDRKGKTRLSLGPATSVSLKKNKELVSVAADRSGIVGSAKDGTLRFWAPNGDLVRSFDAPEASNIAIGPAMVAASYSSPDRVRILDFKGNTVQDLRHEGLVTAMAFHPRGTALLTGGPDVTTRLWAIKAASGAEGRSTFDEDFMAGWKGAAHAAYSADGQYVALAIKDGRVGIWTNPKDPPIAELKISNPIFSMFLPNPDFIAVLQDTGAVQMYKWRDRIRVAGFQPGSAVAIGLVNNSTQLLLFRDDQDMVATPWSAEAVIRDACAAAGRNLRPAEWYQSLPKDEYRRTCTGLPPASDIYRAGAN